VRVIVRSLKRIQERKKFRAGGGRQNLPSRSQQKGGTNVPHFADLYQKSEEFLSKAVCL
jgi:hypothetical protein